jgi:integrase
MPTEACEINPRIVNRAKEMARIGFDGTHTFKDYGKQGLFLRVRGHRATWLTKFKQNTKTIGQLYPSHAEHLITSPSKAREVARDVREILGSQEHNFARYMQLRDQGHNHEAAKEKLIEVPKGWSLAQCFDAYLADKTSTHSKGKVTPASQRDIQYIRFLPTWQDVMNMEVTHLKQGDLERVRDATCAAHGASSSLKLVSYTRSALNWCAKYHNGASGLGHTGSWWLNFSSQLEISAKTRMPSVEQAVRTLWIAEQFLHRPLPNRQCGKKGVTPETLAALWWAVLTCQRTGAAFALSKKDIIRDAHAPDNWRLASWDAEIMKGKKQRIILPVPVQALKHVKKFLAMSKHFEASDLFLPSRLDLTKNVTGSGAYQILSRLAGRDRNKPENDRRLTPKKKPWPDLLLEEGIDWWSPHDIRRSIADFLSDADNPGGASAILTHKIKDSMILDCNSSDQRVYDRMRQSPADVTQKSYGAHSMYMGLKKDAMELWVDAVLEAYERQKQMPWKGDTLQKIFKT